ncbi:MAG: hypothetical protein NTX00_04430 [Candidatus Parcubacteria bacterium]|nr:hypothetical protein [Candidatus Parcubacteria bacterium]
MAKAEFKEMEQADDPFEKWFCQITKSRVKTALACSAPLIIIFFMWLICRLIWGF